METDEINKFAIFLQKYTKKSGRKLGARTISGILTLAKFIPDVKGGEDVPALREKFRDYLSSRNYPLAKYALWLCLKWLDYDEVAVRQIVKFGNRGITALTDEEKLAESVLDKREVVKLVGGIANARDQLVVRLLYDTGARVSELCSIRFSDIDFSANEITLMGKGRKPRQVYFQAETSELLKKWIRQERLKSENLVFGIKPLTVWYNMKKYGRALLNKDLRPHMMRHSRLQHMADDGVDAFSIKAYAGHEDVRTTQIYVKSSKYQRKLAFEKAGNVWQTATMPSMSEISDFVDSIFAQGDSRYDDAHDREIVAGLIEKNAIVVQKKMLPNMQEPAKKDLEGIPAPQQVEKFIASKLLERDGFGVVGFERAFAGRKADVLGRDSRTGAFVAVECGPCYFNKALDYLRNPGTTLWILLFYMNEKALYVVSRGPEWDGVIEKFDGKNLRDMKGVKNPLDKL